MDEFSNKNKPKQIYKLKKKTTKQNKPPKTKRYYAVYGTDKAILNITLVTVTQK